MSDINNKIYDLLDGALPREHEQEIFSALASDQGLRDEMIDQISIRTAINADKRAFVPSPDATAGIMSSLGFAGASAVAGQAVKPVYLKVLQSVLLTATGLLIGFFLGSDFFGSDSGSQTLAEKNIPISSSNTDASNSQNPSSIGVDIFKADSSRKQILTLQREVELLQAENAALENKHNSFSSRDNNSTDNSSTIAANDERMDQLNDRIEQLEQKYYNSLAETGRYKNMYLASDEELTKLKTILDAQHQRADALETKLFELKSQNPLAPPNTEIVNNTPNTLNIPIQNLPPDTAEDINHGLTVYVSGSVFDYENGVKIAPVEYSSFNNMGLGLGYQIFSSLNNSFSLDLITELNRETFSLHYPIRPEDYQSPMANQQPNYNTLTLGARANWVPFSNLDMNLFADITGGPAFSAEVLAVGGAVLRPRFGLEYYISKSGFISGSFNRSYLFYNHEGIDFNNYKNGFTIGMGMDF